jgi:hypothetical protein
MVVFTVTSASGLVQTGGLPAAVTPKAKAVIGFALQSGSRSLAMQATGMESPAKSRGCSTSCTPVCPIQSNAAPQTRRAVGFPTVPNVRRPPNELSKVIIVVGRTMTEVRRTRSYW